MVRGEYYELLCRVSSGDNGGQWPTLGGCLEAREIFQGFESLILSISIFAVIRGHRCVAREGTVSVI